MCHAKGDQHSFLGSFGAVRDIERCLCQDIGAYFLTSCHLEIASKLSAAKWQSPLEGFLDFKNGFG